MKLDDVGRDLGDVGGWLLQMDGAQLPGWLVPLASPAGFLGFVMIGLVVAVFLYWCISDWRRTRKGR